MRSNKPELVVFPLELQCEVCEHGKCYTLSRSKKSDFLNSFHKACVASLAHVNTHIYTFSPTNILTLAI